LTLVCESAVAGDPFARRAVGPVPCALGREAVEILTDLSRRTRSLPEDAATRTSLELNAYLDSFARIYADGDLIDWLRDQVGVLESNGGRLPRVFQHGDPGTWNALATGDGHVSFLDWESADALGMPLWDLFYFLRSYGVTRLRQQGVRLSRVAFERTFFGSSELSTWVRRVIADYAAAIGLERPWVAPLFSTCWMHRSLKEATRLEAQTLGTSHFLNVLRRCRREGDLEARLLGGSPAS
jgi:hypothetical protein